MKKSITVLGAAMFVCGQAGAEEAAKKSLWKASAELGYVSTSGNTSTETLNTKAAVSTDRESWKHKAEVTALKSSDDVDTTAEKYTFFAQSDYKLSKPNFLFGNVNYENDKFSGFEYQVTETVGYGRRVIDNESVSLDLEIGPGSRQVKLDTGEKSSEGIIRGAAKLDWIVSDTSKFAEVLTVEAGDDVTITKSVTSLSSKINSSLSMKITYTYKLTSDVPVGVDDTDTETAVTLVYTF